MRGENLLVGTHKVSTEEFCKQYEEMIWASDSEEVKREKRKRQSLAAKRAQRQSSK